MSAPMQNMQLRRTTELESALRFSLRPSATEENCESHTKERAFTSAKARQNVEANTRPSETNDQKLGVRACTALGQTGCRRRATAATDRMGQGTGCGTSSARETLPRDSAIGLPDAPVVLPMACTSKPMSCKALWSACSGRRTGTRASASSHKTLGSRTP